MNILDFYKPKYKNEYVEWLLDKYPQDKASFKRMKKDQLEAIYIRARNSCLKKGVKDV